MDSIRGGWYRRATAKAAASIVPVNLSIHMVRRFIALADPLTLHCRWPIGALRVEAPPAKPHAMSESGRSSASTPEGWHTVTPRIVAHDALQLVEFLRGVFDAVGDYQETRPSEIRIGDSIIMISDAGFRAPMQAFLYVYVDDIDAVYRRAVDAGARILEEPADTPYGDRRAMMEDRWGNTWQIATPISAARRPADLPA